MINKKTSQFITVAEFDSTTLIPLIQGSPLFNAIIGPSAFAQGLTSVYNNLYIKVDGTNSDLDILKFNTAIDNPELLSGELAFNTSEGTLELGMNHGVVKQSIGLELYYHVKAAENIADGDLVEVYGADGNSGKLVVRKATLYASVNSVIGIATENISNGQNGFVTWFGKVGKINTTGSEVSENWFNGAELYKHPTIAGKLTMVKPTTGNKTQYATVINAHAVNGNLFVRVERSGALGDLNDVNVAGASNLQPLAFDNGVWKPRSELTINKINGGAELNLNATKIVTTGDIEAKNLKASHNVNVTNLIAGNSIYAGDEIRTDGAFSTGYGYFKDGATDNDILLAGSGHKPISDFQLKALTNDVIADAQSTTKYPTVKSIKDYADGLVAGLLDYRGGYDASSNLYPTTMGSGPGGSVLKGDMWVISHEGTLGGIVINAGDSIIANVDNPGQTAANWNTVNSNLSYVPEDVANKSTNITNDTGSDTKYPSVKAVETYAETLANKSTSVTTDGSSNTKYPSVKAVKDYSDTKVSKTGNETIEGIKTFNSSPLVPNPTTSGQALNKGTADAAYVGKTGAETISGVKTFSSSPIVPDSATGQQAINVNQVAAAVINQMPAATNSITPAIQYKTRVDADGGTIRNLKEVNDLYTNNLKLGANTVWMWSGVGAYKSRTSGLLTYTSKIYDMAGSNDAVQATEANQPLLAGTIAPNEKVKLLFPETHKWVTFGSPIEFASGSTWSVTIVFNQLINPVINEVSLLNSNTTSAMINIQDSTGGAYIQLRNNAGNNYQLAYNRGLVAGKNNILTITSDGSTAIFYLNGVVIGSHTISGTSGFRFDGIGNSAQRKYEGTINHVQLFNKKLEADEVNKHYEYLRLLIPEVEGIAIGNQMWATSNLNTNVLWGGVGALGSVAAGGFFMDRTEYIASNSPQLITNGDFSNGLANWSLSSGSTYDDVNKTVTIKDGLFFGGIATAGVNNGVLKQGRLYKIEFDVLSFDPGNTYIIMINSSHIFVSGCIPVVGRAVHYIRATANGGFRICAGGADQNIVITNISLKETGANESTLAYNEVYNRAVPYTNNSVRHMAGLQAAAMWCYYDNNPENAFLGKMYNWYAAELIGLLAPTSLNGWIVPRNENWSQLRTFLGGQAVAGRKVKALFGGFNNTNTNNESGFSAIPTGGRNQAGVFAEIETMSYYHTRENSFAQFMHKNSTFEIYGLVKEYFIPIRLMREEPVGPNERKVVEINNNNFDGGWDIPIPFGYTVEAIKVKNNQLHTSLTSFQAVLYNSAGINQGTLVTGKTINANTTMLFNPAILEIPPLMSDGYVKVSAVGNTVQSGGRPYGGGTEVTLVLRKVLI